MTVGVRIHKVVGWALTDLEHDGMTLTDPRINQSVAFQSPPDDFVPLYMGYLKEVGEGQLPDSDEHFDVQGEIMMLEVLLEQGRPLYWPVVRDGEYGRPDVLVIRPPAMPEWERYGDPIDHLDESNRNPDGLIRVEPLPFGVYPYEGLYMDSRDGRHLDSTAKRTVDRLADRFGGDNGEKFRRAADHLARSVGFEDADQALVHTAPRVPGDVLRFASWLGLFTGPDVWLQLRPVLYVYWS